MLKKIEQDTETRMKKALESLSHGLAKLRTDRAHPSILESVSVLYYGNPTPLNQVASISIEDARTLSITPFDKAAIQAIDKAIRASDLGLNPTTAGTIIRVMLPPLTEERRRDLVKHVRNEAEEARVVVRNIRRDANAEIKQLLKVKNITEDDERRATDVTQKLTDRFVAEIDKLVTLKETELMRV
ncbi:MAG TPA: ribosome recycling factor [Gammaproteobacteria bacterium]|nr:ribosome recycling factor [Gammaproteobacteria bacterium]